MDKTLQPHELRVVDEKDALDDKIGKLAFFIDGKVCATLPVAEQVRLARQLAAMNMYSAVLGERIAAFVAAAPRADVYSRDECVFRYCAAPNACKSADRCVNK